MNLFGHQSEHDTIFSLLMKFPQFDESPGCGPPQPGHDGGEFGFYCKSLCPRHPDLYSVLLRGSFAALALVSAATAIFAALTTPRDVLARQLASQETAFAIPDPGPVQRDDFPLLEYAAPRAMFIYSGRQAERLQRFDERTWQSHLAPAGKDRTLSQLNDVDLEHIFGEFPSVDPGLQQFVRARVEGSLSADLQLRSLPCIFRGANETAVFNPPDATETFKQLADADARLENSTSNQTQAVVEIKNILDSVQNYNRQGDGWSAGYYASLAAEVSLRLGNPAEAKAILLRGLQLDPDSDELNYLLRIFIRRGIVQSSEIQ